MSRFSGKCDLFDSMMMGQEDEFDAFIDFKEKTGGVLYQYRKIKVTESNRDWAAKHTSLSWSSHTVEKTDKNGNKKEALETEYCYYNKHFDSLKKLNKNGVYVRMEIHFDSILDLIPYYPYVPAVWACSEGQLAVVLPEKSFVEKELDYSLESDYVEEPYINMTEWHRRELQNHYKEVIEKYYAVPKSKSHFPVTMDRAVKVGDHYEMTLPDDYKVDPLHEVSWKIRLPASKMTNDNMWNNIIIHWTSPKLKEGTERTIVMSAVDIETCLKDKLDKDLLYVEFVNKN